MGISHSSPPKSSDCPQRSSVKADFLHESSFCTIDPHLYHLNRILQKAQRLQMNNICKVTSVLITWFTDQNLLTFIWKPFWAWAACQVLGTAPSDGAHLVPSMPCRSFLRCVYPTRNPGREEGGPERKVVLLFSCFSLLVSGFLLKTSFLDY